MKIIVCIKQVPGTTKVDIDAETGTLLRGGVESKMNPYDLYALETALRITEDLPAPHTITVLTMGPPQAADIIREAYTLGADEGYLLSDARFAGADVLATSYALSQAIEKIGNYDLIICGKQTTDGDTAQVGPAVAELLGLPHITWVSRIIEATPEHITVEQDLTDFTQTARMNYKCLITVEKDIFQPRLPSYKLKLRTASRKINVLGLDDLDGADVRRCGLKGSPTRVEKIFAPEVNEGHIMLTGDTAELSEKLYSAVKDFI